MAYAFIGTSEIRKLAESWDIELIVKRSTEAIAFAVKEGVEVAYVTEDTTRARPETLREIWKSALETGARRLWQVVRDQIIDSPAAARIVAIQAHRLFRVSAAGIVTQPGDAMGYIRPKRAQFRQILLVRERGASEHAQ